MTERTVVKNKWEEKYMKDHFYKTHNCLLVSSFLLFEIWYLWIALESLFDLWIVLESLFENGELIQNYSGIKWVSNLVNISTCAILQGWSLNILEELCKCSQKYTYTKEGTKAKICIVTCQLYKDSKISEHTKQFWVKPHLPGFYDRKVVVKSLQTEMEKWCSIFYCTILLCDGLLRVKK